LKPDLRKWPGIPVNWHKERSSKLREQPLSGEVLSPQRSRFASSKARTGGVLRDENLDLLAHLLDDWFRIPGTGIRLGLDGIIGLIPGLGDVLTGLLACILIFAAWLRGLPYIALARMAVNLGIGVVIGSIPFLGDIFDIAWKANRRNYALMQRHLQHPHRHTWKDWVFLFVLASMLAAIFLAPIAVTIWLIWILRHRF
jgi:Domain of unknown function (DUF4112)